MKNEHDAIRVQQIPALVTVEETASLLRIGQVKTHELLRSGRLRSVVIGGSRRITGESIAELLRESEQTTYAPTRESPRKRTKVAA